MSRLIEIILSSIDFYYAAKKHLQNFRYPHKKLYKLNAIAVDPPQASGPLCYPFATQDSALRNRLLTARIFVATYWREAVDRVTEEWAESMIMNLLPLPIDQRYGLAHMERIVAIVTGEH